MHKDMGMTFEINDGCRVTWQRTIASKVQRVKQVACGSRRVAESSNGLREVARPLRCYGALSGDME
jgi:hypothetical protein